MATFNIPRAEDKRIYTIRETAQHFHTSRETLRKWRKAGLIKATEFQVPYVTATLKKAMRTQVGFLGKDMNEFASCFLPSLKR